MKEQLFNTNQRLKQYSSRNGPSISNPRVAVDNRSPPRERSLPLNNNNNNNDAGIGNDNSNQNNIGNNDPSLLHYAKLQANKDEEFQKTKSKVGELSMLLHESESMNQLHLLQINALKEDIRELERSQKREGANLEYLKNIVVKYMMTGDHDVRSLLHLFSVNTFNITLETLPCHINHPPVQQRRKERNTQRKE